jgi:hypothetical protein
MADEKNVEIVIPNASVVENRVTGEKYEAVDGRIKLDFYAGQLYTLYVQ